MKVTIAALAIIISTSAIAGETQQPPRAALAPRDATEVLQLLSSSEIKGADVPETYRLMALLSQIAQNQPQQGAEQEKSLIQREAEHAPKK